MLTGSCLCGAVTWRLAETPDHATACNCTACRRYGSLWGYGYENEDLFVDGPSGNYVRGDKELAFHFCNTCGCLTYWRGVEPGPDGRRRMAVNLRLAEPEAVADVKIKHFDGLDTWRTVEREATCVADMWY
ncbi:GFA family protein [Pseudoruegeria sp. HB172150]|uniref:GFA family protein n=1 Tax=Pseudoruegeria sp. HB172150 TaxID=2721164 RepID=UPI0015571A0E|nr:GFA family protein [Pseudoruegeria sp. HB172150]